MPMWRCPHCGTPQTETARCWVCHRSSTACGTCRNFRRSVAAQLGYCGLDRQRHPLRGDEIRACWQAAATTPDVPPVAVRPSSESDPVRTFVRRIDFVEVPPLASATDTPPAAVSSRRRVRTSTAVEREPDGVVDDPIVGRPVDPGWSLWSDAEL